MSLRIVFATAILCAFTLASCGGSQVRSSTARSEGAGQPSPSGVPAPASQTILTSSPTISGTPHQPGPRLQTTPLNQFNPSKDARLSVKIPGHTPDVFAFWAETVNARSLEGRIEGTAWVDGKYWRKRFSVSYDAAGKFSLTGSYYASLPEKKINDRWSFTDTDCKVEKETDTRTEGLYLKFDCEKEDQKLSGELYVPPTNLWDHKK